MKALRIARLEWRMALADGSLPVVLVATVVLMLFAGFNGLRWQRFRAAATAAIEQRAARDAAVWIEDARRDVAGVMNPGYQKPSNPYFVYAFFPQYATARPSALSTLAVGQTDLHAYYAARNGVTPNTLSHEEEIQNPVILAMGRFDPSFFLVVVLPVLIIALTYDLVADDRRSGRERMWLLPPSGVAALVTFRGALRFAWIAAATLLPLAIVMAAPTFVGFGWPNASAVVTTLLMVTGYMAFWAGLAIVVNARGQSSTRNAVVLLALWGGLTLFAPAAIDLLARMRHPLPGGMVRPTEERRVLQSISDSSALLRLTRDEPLPLTASPTVKKEAGWVAGAELRRDTVEAARAVERQVLRRRQELADRMAWLSPPLVLFSALERTANATLRDALAFEERIAARARERGLATRRNVVHGTPFSVAELEQVAATVLDRVTPGDAASVYRLAGAAVLWLSSLAIGAAGYLSMRGATSDWAGPPK